MTVLVKGTFASLKKGAIQGLWKSLYLYRRVVAQYVALAAKQVLFYSDARHRMTSC